MTIRKFLAVAVLVLTALAARTEAANLTVCASGCTYTNSQLQTALDAANPGDSVLLQAGFTYVGNYTLRRHGGTSYVTVRTGVTSTGSVISTGTFPAAGMRMTDALATTLNLAILKSNASNSPALRTADPSGGVASEYWTIKWIKIVAGGTGGVFHGGGSLMALGDDSNSIVTQASEIPSHFILDQMVLAGDPVRGQFRGLQMHANDTTLKNSSIIDIKSNSEGQAIFLNSSVGPYLIDNNYIVGNGENVLSGGSGGAARPTVTVLASPTPTTTSATLSRHDGLYVGQGISFDITLGGVTVEQRTEVVSCGTSTAGAACTSDAITFGALDAAPNSPGDADYGPVPGNLTFTRNFVEKPLDWRNPILGTPQNVVASSTTGGTLVAGTYAYRVVARLTVAFSSAGSTARSTASNEVTATLSSTGSVKVRWSPVTNADTYYIYGRSAGGENIRWSVTTSACTGSPVVCEYIDTGSAGTSEAVPTSTGTTWFIKNIFELKIMDTAVIEGNVFSGVWLDGQTGYAIVLTPANTGGSNDSDVVRNITFRNNIIKNAAGGFQITARDVGATNPSGRTSNILVHNNLLYDVGSSFGSSLRTFLFSTRAYMNVYPTGTAMGPKDVTITHNSFVHTSGNATMYFDLYKSGLNPIDGFIVRNNIFYKLNYGVTGGNGCGEGDSGTVGCFTMHTTGVTSWQKNIVADANCNNYPGGSAQNFCPSTATLKNEYTDFDNDNYALKSTSTYHNAGTDATDLGANITTVKSFTDVALSGDATGGTPVVPPTITVTSLPNGNTGATYSVQMTATGCSPTCTWSVSGQPTGLTMNSSGLLSGVPTVAGTYSVVVTATSSGTSSNATFSVTISSPTPPPDDDDDDGVGTPRPKRPSRWNGMMNNSFVGPDQPTEDGTLTLKVGDTWWDTTNNALKVLSATGPNPVWTTVSGSTGMGSMPFHVPTTSSNTWTDMPIAETELLGTASKRIKFDATRFTQVRLAMRVQGSSASANTPKCYLRYSLDESTWVNLATDVSLSTSGTKASVWVNLPSEAKTDAFWSVACSGGDATADPAIGTIIGQLK